LIVNGVYFVRATPDQQAQLRTTDRILAIHTELDQLLRGRDNAVSDLIKELEDLHERSAAEFADERMGAIGSYLLNRGLNDEWEQVYTIYMEGSVVRPGDAFQFFRRHCGV
jgi:hypothetical protein